MLLIVYCTMLYSMVLCRYAFGILMWEVLTERRPFEDVRSETMLCSRVHLGYRPDLSLVAAGDGAHAMAAQVTTTLSTAATTAASSCDSSTATTVSAVESTEGKSEAERNGKLLDNNKERYTENSESMNNIKLPTVEDMVISEMRKLVACNWSADRSVRKTGVECCEILQKCSRHLQLDQMM